jgi:energy-coupling factor transport system permease protein
VTAPHPFTQLALAGAVPALAWILPAPLGPAVMLAAAAGLCLSAGGPGFGMLRTGLLTAAPFWVFIYILQGPAAMLAIGLRVTAMIVSAVWIVTTLPPARLVEALVAAGWGVNAAYLFAATLSAVPTLKARASRIVDAQRCRGLSTRGGPWARARALRALALPLVLSALHEVDERALALETRGLASGAGIRRTALAPPPDSLWQGALRWGLIALCAAALWWRLA